MYVRTKFQYGYKTTKKLQNNGDYLIYEIDKMADC